MILIINEINLNGNKYRCIHYRDTGDFSEDQIQHLESIFQKHLSSSKERLTFKEFKNLLPSKNVSLQNHFCVVIYYNFSFCSFQLINSVSAIFCGKSI